MKPQQNPPVRNIMKHTLLLIPIILLIFQGCITTNIGYIDMNKYIFPEDEGRHEAVNESWWFGSYVTSENDDEFFICGLYVMRHTDTLIQSVIVKDIKKDILYSNTKQVAANSFTYASDKLFFEINPNEKWYQITSQPFTYTFQTKLTDKHYEITLDLNIKSCKGPTIQDTLGRINDILNDTAYYDHTNCEISGQLSMFNKEITVQGTGYISREWGKKLGGHWQWSAIQLDNEYEICAAKFQTLDGVKDEGWIVNPDGEVKVISDLTISLITYTSTWWSEKWQLSSEDIDFNITVELVTDLYNVIGLNEGLCFISGTFKNQLIKGICFTEQTIRFPNE